MPKGTEKRDECSIAGDASNLPAVIIAAYQLGFGGATHAIFDEARLFSELGHRTILATFNNDPGFVGHIQEYRNQGKIPPNVEVRNLHWDTQHRGRRGEQLTRRISSVVRRWHSSKPLFKRSSRAVEGALSVVRTFTRSGHLGRVQKFNEAGTLSELQRISLDGVVTVDSYQPAYRYYRTRRNAGEEHHFEEQYFANDGFCYMSRTVDARTGYGSGVDVFLRGSRQAQHFHGIPAWQTHWLQGLVDEVGGRPYVIGEAPSIIPKIARLRRDSAVRMAKLHNNHNEVPYLSGSALRDDHKDIFGILDRLDALVVLTEGQREDIAKYHHSGDNVFVIPNVLWPRELENVDRDPNLVGVVSRIAPQKALHEAIEAFRLVLEKHPRARLQIWGRGPDQAKIKALIKKYGLDANIRMMGRTNDPDAALQSCGLSISTSMTESFSLAIAESSLNRTPVVSYDCPFGPRSLIKNGETGFLVERGDVRALADRIVSLLDDPKLAQRMGAAAQQHVTTIVGPSEVVPQWSALFRELTQRRMQD